MVNKDSIVKDLRTRKYTQGQIAKKHKCGTSTVWRIANASGLSPGQGVRNYWEFTKITPELSYLIGVYLTDGHTPKHYKSDKRRAFILSCVDNDFAEYTQLCISSIGLKFSIKDVPPHKGRWGNKMQVKTACYSSMFAQWLVEITDNKQKIPELIFNSTQECILEFIAACIDGDGSVGKDGSIVLSNTGKWILQFKDLLGVVNIMTGGLRERLLFESGKMLYGISIRRGDFRKLGGECKIKRKQDRVLYGKEERTWRRPKRYKYICPACSEKVMSRKDAKQCQRCHLNSDELKERLRSQASKAGIAGCKSRWG